MVHTRGFAVLGIAVLLSALSGSARSRADEARYQTRLTREGRGLACVLPSTKWEGSHPGLLGTLPAPTVDDHLRMDLRGSDLSRLDLTSSRPDLELADFDTGTRWPHALPPGFDPARRLEIAKSPGPGLPALHRQGITGRGVGVGLVDQGLLVGHAEYRDRLRLYEHLHCSDGMATMHGCAVASLAVGRSVGVAPEADLYYIAETHVRGRDPGLPPSGEREPMDFTVTAHSIDRLLEVSRQLPASRRIRVISISVGWAPGDIGYEEVMAAVRRATRDGVFVVSTSLEETHGLSFHGLGRDPSGDPEALASYTLPPWGNEAAGPLLHVPMDARTTASPTGENEYVFYREGAWSWVVPYLAGLYALAAQVKPSVTPEEFWRTALATADTVTLPRSEVAARIAQLQPRGAADNARALAHVLEHRALYDSEIGMAREAFKAICGLLLLVSCALLWRARRRGVRWGAGALAFLVVEVMLLPLCFPARWALALMVAFAIGSAVVWRLRRPYVRKLAGGGVVLALTIILVAQLVASGRGTDWAARDARRSSRVVNPTRLIASLSR